MHIIPLEQEGSIVICVSLLVSLMIDQNPVLLLRVSQQSLSEKNRLMMMQYNQYLLAKFSYYTSVMKA